MLRYLLVFCLPLAAPKPSLLSTHEEISLDDDKSLEEYALLQRNAKRYNAGKRQRGELNTKNLEDISPGLNRFLKNNTEVESDLPHWKKQLMRMQAETDLLTDVDQFERGTFSLPEWLKKQGDVSTKAEDLPKIYLCSARKRDLNAPACCVGKDTECFTDGGCFCDESCQQYDDCCPDYDDTCMETLSLCLLTPAPPLKGPPKASSPKGPSLKVGGQKSGGGGNGGGNAVRLEPNRCCGIRPYNDGDRCCCEGDLVDVPCEENPCN